MKVSFYSIGLVTCLLAGSVARADTFTMTWTGGYGPGDATLTATLVTTDEWLVTALTGTQNSESISLDPSLYGGADDDIFQPPIGLLDIEGVAIKDSTGTKFDIFADPSFSTNFEECSSAVETNCTGAVPPSLVLSSFDITPGTPSTSTVPEPTALPLALGVLVAIATIVVQRRRRSSQAVS